MNRNLGLTMLIPHVKPGQLDFKLNCIFSLQIQTKRRQNLKKRKKKRRLKKRKQNLRKM